VERPPWSPAQFVALIVGAIFVIIGAVALAKTGVNFSDVTSNHAEVAGIDHTPILATIELVLGLFLIGAGAIPGGARGGMTFFGVLLLGFGIVMILSDSTPSFDRWMGGGSGAGWFYVITGVVLLLAAMVAPIIFGSDRRAVGRREVIAR
jgi:hypothetical protein